MSAYGVSWGDRKGGRKRGTAAFVGAAAVLAVAVQGATAGAGSVGAGPVGAVRAAHGTAGAAVKAAAGLTGHRPVTLTAKAPAPDPGAVVSPEQLATVTGAKAYWKSGDYGQGIGVALVDSGVVPVDGLHGKIFNGPDLTPESQSPTQAHLDGYGHGTFMAGLIAGRQDAATAPYDKTDAFVGMAPDAHIVSVKVADAAGRSDESSVLAGIDWVIAHRNDPGLNIRVLNLSLTVPDTVGYRNDPLAAAVERAWAAGLVVVTSAGNDGAYHLGIPAADPYVVTVGASVVGGTNKKHDDSVASYSDAGWSSAARHPDLVAPGSHVTSLRDPGSYIDEQYGDTARVGDDLFLGSGTSQAAAVASGAAALILSQNPSLTPDQVKATLMQSAKRLPGWPKFIAGGGELNLGKALTMTTPTGTQDWPHAIGWNTAPNAPDGGAWSPVTDAGSTWTGSTWTGSTWTGSTWTGSTWTGSTWTGSTWTGSTWTGSTWTGSTWTGSTWTGSTWTDWAWE